MTDKQIIKQLAERYKEICRSPFADGYTFRAFDGECAEKGFTIDDIKNYIEKEKQEQKAKLTESIKSLKEQRKRKEQECEKLKQALTEIKKIAKEQVPYLNIGEAKTMIEIEYDYAGAICNLEQRMSKILQKISECEVYKV